MCNLLPQCVDLYFDCYPYNFKPLSQIRKGLPVPDESTLEMYGVDTGNLRKSQTEVGIG